MMNIRRSYLPLVITSVSLAAMYYMHTHSQKTSSLLMVRDGEIFHWLYKGNSTNKELDKRFTDTIAALLKGGDRK